MKIRCGDEVVLLSGKDKNKRGQVMAVFPKKAGIKVRGVALVKRHVKPNPQHGVAGGVLTTERMIPVCKVAIFNQETGKGDRIGFKVEDGKKVRYFKSNGALVD